MAELNCIVVTPEKTALETKAEFVAMPLYDGEIGILPGHSPMIGRLGYGEMRIRAGGKETRYYVDGGFVQVADNVVSILTNRAVLGTSLDGEAARVQLAAAKRTATTDEELQLRDRLVIQARAQIRLAGRSK
ncbi:MAG: ATP synthase F1 subunit epsilon [Planctomycetia bacterium]|nr:ATP synthase F1 subunit epsilon [Planctomycetia bacterium]